MFSLVFHDLQNYNSYFISEWIGKYNFKTNFIPKTIEQYISFTIQQPKKKGIKPRLPLVLIDRVHFLNNYFDNSVKSLAENDFYHLSQEYNANLLDLLKKKDYFPMTTGIALKNSKKTDLPKLSVLLSFDKFQKGLSTKNLFYATLSNREISD